MGLANTNGQHHEHQLRIALAPQSTGHHHESSLETRGPGTHERPASPASAANFEIALAPQSTGVSTGHHHEISLETLGPGTHERPASPASAANCFWPRNQQVIITRSDWKHLGLAHTNGQHHQHQLRIALAPQSTGHHHEISLETLGPGTHERPASRASAANCFGPEINRSSSRHQLGNTWAWHTRTASITSISCELLLAPKSTSQHNEISLETLRPGTHERPASPASAANFEIALAPQSTGVSTGHHHEISLETLGPGTHERPASPASAANF